MPEEEFPISQEQPDRIAEPYSEIIQRVQGGKIGRKSHGAFVKKGTELGTVEVTAIDLKSGTHVEVTRTIENSEGHVHRKRKIKFKGGEHLRESLGLDEDQPQTHVKRQAEQSQQQVLTGWQH